MQQYPVISVFPKTVYDYFADIYSLTGSKQKAQIQIQITDSCRLPAKIDALPQMEISIVKKTFSYHVLPLSLPSLPTPGLQPHPGHAEMVSQRSRPTQLRVTAWVYGV